MFCVLHVALVPVPIAVHDTLVWPFLTEQKSEAFPEFVEQNVAVPLSAYTCSCYWHLRHCRSPSRCPLPVPDPGHSAMLSSCQPGLGRYLQPGFPCCRFGLNLLLLSRWRHSGPHRIVSSSPISGLRR